MDPMQAELSLLFKTEVVQNRTLYYKLLPNLICSVAQKYMDNAKCATRTAQGQNNEQHAPLTTMLLTDE